jgi:hypothetical protein
MTKMIFAVLVGALGCSASLSPAQQARQDRFECEAAAFAPILPAGIDAVELVARLYSGSASLQSVLGNLEPAQAELEALSNALDACRAAPLQTVPASAKRVVAPPPAYGNKVI